MTSKKIRRANGGGYTYLYLDGRVNEKRYVGHNGGVPGINPEFQVFPDSGYATIVLATLAAQLARLRVKSCSRAKPRHPHLIADF